MEKKDYICKICNKFYKNYKSLWKHNYKYHKPNVVQSCSNVVENCSNVVQSKENVVENVVESCSNVVESFCSIDKKKRLTTTCKYCNENFCDRTYRWRHEKICKLKDTIKEENTIMFEEKIKELEQKHKQEMEQFKNDLLKSLKIHHKQLQKINNQLNLNQQNNINNTSVYCQLGYENF